MPTKLAIMKTKAGAPKVGLLNSTSRELAWDYKLCGVADPCSQHHQTYVASMRQQGSYRVTGLGDTALHSTVKARSVKLQSETDSSILHFVCLQMSFRELTLHSGTPISVIKNAKVFDNLCEARACQTAKTIVPNPSSERQRRTGY
jgi:hypothetical protein